MKAAFAKLFRKTNSQSQTLLKQPNQYLAEYVKDQHQQMVKTESVLDLFGGVPKFKITAKSINNALDHVNELGGDEERRAAINHPAIKVNIKIKGKKDVVEFTILQAAAYIGRVDLVERSLQMGADIGDGNFDGMTPLHFAALGGNKEVIKCLLKNGAPIGVGDEDGKTALDYSIALSDADTVKMMLDYNTVFLRRGDKSLVANKDRVENLKEIQKYLTENNGDINDEAGAQAILSIINNSLTSLPINDQASSSKISVGQPVLARPNSTVTVLEVSTPRSVDGDRGVVGNVR